MQSPSKHSRLSRMFLLNSFVSILLLLVIDFGFAEEEKATIELSNWVQTSIGKWPTDQNDRKPIYFYRNEYNENLLFGLNKKLLSETNLPTSTVDFSFKYWTDSNTSSFRSKLDKVLEAKFGTLNQWTDSSNLRNLTLKQFSNFEFRNLHQFTVAFKDVKVQYLEQLTLDKLDLSVTGSQIHGYKTEPSNRNLNIKQIGGGTSDSKTFSIQKTPKNIKTPIVSFLNLIESQSQDGDSCYQLDLTAQQDNRSFEIYFTFENANQGIKLLSIDKNNENSTTTFCINDYISLRNLKNYQLTFVILGKTETEFQIKINTKSQQVGNKFNIRSPSYDDNDEQPLTNGWFYYNQVYDYSIGGPEGQQLFACDLVANCFPFEEINPGKYEIRKDMRKFLRLSPFVRFQIEDKKKAKEMKFFTDSDDSVTDTFVAQLIAKNAFKGKEVANYHENSAWKNTINVSINKKDKIKFDQESNAIKLQIPLDNIDLRAHQLITKISITSSPKNPKLLLKLLNLSYNNRVNNATVNFPFQDPTLGSQGLSIIKFDNFQFSTQSWFAVHPTEIQGSLNDGKFIEFSLEITEPVNKPKCTIQFDFKIEKSTLESIEEHPAINDQIKLKFISKPINELTPVTRIDRSKALKLTGVKEASIFTNWIRAGAGRKFEDTKLNVAFSLTLNPPSDPVTKNWPNLSNFISIFRVISTQTSPILTQLTAECIFISANNSKTLKIEDNFSKDLNKEVKTQTLSGSFRIGYVFLFRKNIDANLTVSKFEVMSPELTNVETNCKGPRLALLDCKYEKNVCPETFSNDEKGECKLSTMYKFSQKECDSTIGCSNIFDRPLATSTEFSTAESDSRYIPHQITEKEDLTSHYLKIEPKVQPESGKDFCIQFDYTSKMKSIFASTNETNTSQYSFEFPETGKIQDKDTPTRVDQKVCASYLSNDVTKVEAIYFRFQQTPIIDTDNFYLKNVHANVGENSLEILKSIPLGKPSKTQFINPSSEWDFTENLVNFTISDLAKLRTENGDSFVSFLRTNWLEVPNPEHFGQFRLGLKLSGEGLKENFYKISIKVSSPEELLISKSISSTDQELINDKMNVFTLKSNSIKFYQLTIKLTLEMKDLELKPNEAFVITFEKFTINDPCVDEKTNNLVTCNGRSKTCERKYDTFTYVCKNCQTGYKGDHCEIDDYCNQADPDTKEANSKTCTKSGAECKNVEGTFECVCKEAKKSWDFSFKKCVTKTVHCKENQDSLVDGNGEVKCVCTDGYVSLKGDQSDCEKFNPCDPKHRAKNTKLDQTICKDPNAACQVIDFDPSSPILNHDHSCKCNPGYVNAFGDLGPNSLCLHVKCEVDSNVCEQKCVPKGEKFECACYEGYSLENGKCKPKDSKLTAKCQSKSSPAPFVNVNGNCACAQWYKWNTTDCVFDTDKNGDFGTKFKCSKGVKLVDNKPACDCDDKTEVLDTETRTCKPRTECTQIEKDKCKHDHSASECKISKGDLICECDSNQIKYATSKADLDKNKWSCMGKCPLLSEGDFKNRNLACNGDFQKCNDAKVLTIKEVTLNGSQFIVEGISNISPSKADYCSCSMGFQFHSESSCCIPRKDPQVDLSIDFEVDKDPEIIRIYFERLIQTQIVRNTFLDRIQCQKSKDLVSCSTSFPSEKPLVDIKKALDKFCVPLDGSSKCAYMLPALSQIELQMQKLSNHRIHKRSTMFAETYYDSNQLTNILIRDSKKPPKIETVDLCKSANPCTSFEYSLCKSITNTSNVECVCDSALFDASSTKSEQIPQTDLKMSLQTCKVKANLCNQDQYKCQSDAKCNLDVTFDAAANRYTAQSFCSCGFDSKNGTGFTLPNKNLSCTQTCKNACGDNFESCAQNIYDQKYTCVCKKGYEGAKCDSKTGANIFLYLTIGVSVVAVLAIIGLGIFYYKRRH